MSDWRPHRDPKEVGGFAVQYMTSSTHSHEGAHRITVADVSVLVAPDGRTTARNRSAVITRLLEAVDKGVADPHLTVAALIGGLVLEGITIIEVDGQPIMPDDGDRIGSIRLDIIHRGGGGIEVELTDMGGTGGPR